MSTLAWLAIGVALGIGAVIYLSARAKKKKSSPKSLMKRLVKLTHDREVARRLLEGERSRNPELTEIQLLKRVIRRLSRDRRR